MNLRLPIVALFMMLLAANSCAQDQLAQMPDYQTWDMNMDHTEKYLYKGKPVDLRDQHYMFVNAEKTEAKGVVLFYNPDNNQPWFAININQYSDPDKEDKKYLFQIDNGEWKLVQDITQTKDLGDTFRFRYELQYIK